MKVQLFTASLSLFVFAPLNASQKPNVVFIIADDLGYGDLSCYGQEKFQTPNIDRLALSGTRYTRSYSGTTVSAPSRASLLTGLHTGHTPIRGNKEIQPEGQAPLPSGTFTLFHLFKRSEEHTSELQSRPHLVCRLLLEKKKSNLDNEYMR